jgi:transcription elongation factor GreA
MQNFRPQPKQPLVPLTQQAHDELRAKVVKLMREREEAKERLSVAREMGDLSENGAYKYAKFEISSLNRQLRDIHHQLDTSVVTSVKSHYSKVEFGSQVTLLLGDKEITYTITGKFESNPLEYRISLESPLGLAIAGKEVGYKTQFQTPKGPVDLEILNVK